MGSFFVVKVYLKTSISYSLHYCNDMKKQKKSSKESTTNYKAVFSYLRYTYKQFPKSGLIALISRVVSTAVFVIPPIFYKQIIDILSST